MPYSQVRALVFVILLGTIHAVLWFVGNTREGVWTQAPATDQAHDLTTAWVLYHALTRLDLFGLAHGWMHGSPVHTPLVPFMSAVAMRFGGESRVIAEAVLPMATVVWLIATYAVVYRLFRRTSTALWTVALVSTFPVFLIYSRTYLFEHPLAAVFTCACWALLASEGFSRPLPSAMFGLLAGLTCLTRGGAPVYLAGPLIVTLWAVWRRPDRRPRLIRCAAALLVGACIAATWYGPNAINLMSYIYRATYGEDAAVRTGGESAFSAANASYYLTWIVAQGPGVPMLATVVFGTLAGWLAGRRIPRPTPTAIALGGVLAIDCVLLLVAAQHQAARYFQPLMGLVAIGIIRSIEAIPPRALRVSIGVATLVFALHHVLAFTIPLPREPIGHIPYVKGLPLWHHQPYFAGLTNFYGIHPVSQDFRLGETLDLIGLQGIPSGAVIATLEAPHPFFQPNGLQLESVRRKRDWRFVWLPFLEEGTLDAAGRAFAALPIDAVLLRTDGPSRITTDAIRSAFPQLFDAHRAVFRRVDRQVTLGDGSHVSLYVRTRHEAI